MERASERAMAVQVTLYLNEADEWHKRPLHLEILNYLRSENVAGATVFHAVAAFTGRARVHTTSLVGAGGKLPLVLDSVEHDEDGNGVLPQFCQMPAHPLIVRVDDVIQHVNLD